MAKFIKKKPFYCTEILHPLLSITFPQGFQKFKKVGTLDFRKWGQKDVNGVKK